MVLPRGLEAREGSSYHWAGWSANPHYVPARCTYSYDRSVFPWAGAILISRLSLRRDTGVRTPFTAHSKQLKIKMSTDGFEPNRPRFVFGDNLGKNAAYVFGDRSNYQRVDFPASSRMRSPAPFEVQILLDRPFLVPANAKSLQVDFIVQSNDSQEGTWYVDAEYQQGALDGGWVERLGGKCPKASKPPVASLMWPGADVYFYCETGEPDVPVLGFLGSRLQKPWLLGGACSLHVKQLVTLVRRTASDPEGQVKFDYGRIPQHNHLVGKKIAFQAAIFRTGLPIQSAFGLSDALEVRIGQGYPSKVSLGTVYSYGDELSPKDPDARFSAAYLSSRAVVLGIN